MKTFQQCKDEVAKEFKCTDFSDFEDSYYDDYDKVLRLLSKAAELLANSRAEEAWEEGLAIGLKAFENDTIPHNPYKELPKHLKQ